MLNSGDRGGAGLGEGDIGGGGGGGFRGGSGYEGGVNPRAPWRSPSKSDKRRMTLGSETGPEVGGLLLNSLLSNDYFSTCKIIHGYRDMMWHHDINL